MSQPETLPQELVKKNIMKYAQTVNRIRFLTNLLGILGERFRYGSSVYLSFLRAQQEGFQLFLTLMVLTCSTELSLELSSKAVRRYSRFYHSSTFLPKK